MFQTEWAYIIFMLLIEIHLMQDQQLLPIQVIQSKIAVFFHKNTR